MAVVPRRRSLIGRAAARAGATDGGGSARTPGDDTPRDSTGESGAPNPEGVQTALHAARPGAHGADVPPPVTSLGREDGSITGSNLEIVEHARPGRGFEGVANQDSFAMDDPPSEEVRLDPRFARAFEPATELMDREQLAAFGAPDTLTEDELDAVLAPRQQTPSPASRGWIPSSNLKGTVAADDPATERVLVPGPVLDPATERIAREHLPPELLAERTVPSGVSPDLLEPDDEPEASAGQRVEATRSVETAGLLADDDDGPIAKALPVPLDEPLSTTVPSQRAEELFADPEPPRTGLPPLVGLVALVGSGGVIAGIALGAVGFVLLFVFLYAGGDDPVVPEPTPLPPIELVPEPDSVGAIDEAEPEGPLETPEPNPTQRRRTPKPEPEAEPPPPAPAPAPAPAVREELPDPDPDPEPERRGPFGRGKKK